MRPSVKEADGKGSKGREAADDLGKELKMRGYKFYYYAECIADNHIWKRMVAISHHISNTQSNWGFMVRGNRVKDVVVEVPVCMKKWQERSPTLEKQ